MKSKEQNSKEGMPLSLRSCCGASSPTSPAPSRATPVPTGGLQVLPHLCICRPGLGFGVGGRSPAQPRWLAGWLAGAGRGVPPSGGRLCWPHRRENKMVIEWQAGCAPGIVCGRDCLPRTICGRNNGIKLSLNTHCKNIKRVFFLLLSSFAPPCRGREGEGERCRIDFFFCCCAAFL